MRTSFISLNKSLWKTLNSPSLLSPFLSRTGHFKLWGKDYKNITKYKSSQWLPESKYL